jgi:hypothetical protein
LLEAYKGKSGHGGECSGILTPDSRFDGVVSDVLGCRACHVWKQCRQTQAVDVRADSVRCIKPKYRFSLR